MALTKQGDFTFNHADQVDRPAYTAAENKAKFDSRASELKATLNGLIDDLEATTDGASGADSIGATTVGSLSGATVQAILEEMDTAIGSAATASALAAHLAEAVYLQEDEPEATNSTTLWFDSSSEIDFSAGGVAIYNAETSTTPPETVFWFQPV